MDTDRLGTVVQLAVYGSAPLLFIVMGLVEYIKKAGAEGQRLLIASGGLGLVAGVLYMGLTSKPDDALGWFLCAAYGIVIGLIASGVYDAMKSATATGVRNVRDEKGGKAG